MKKIFLMYTNLLWDSPPTFSENDKLFMVSASTRDIILANVVSFLWSLN